MPLSCVDLIGSNAHLKTFLFDKSIDFILGIADSLLPS
jgi:hypothetical protein